MRLRFLLAIALLLGLTAGLGVLWLTPQQQTAAGASGEASIGGDFDLVDQGGQPVTNDTYDGRYRIVYFGFTHCPDVCPTGLATITAAYRDLPADERARVVPMFVTVDPERDTVDAMRDYVALFDPDLVGLTGTVEQVEAAKKTYRVYAQKAGKEGDADYLVDHSAFVYLMDPDGRYLAHFGPDATAEEIAKDVRATIEGTV